MTFEPVGVPQAKYEPRLPGDKSISHRVLIMSALAKGLSRIQNLSNSDDVIATQNILKSLGINIWQKGDVTNIEGLGFQAFRAPIKILDACNSGTTARHLLGLLAFSGFDSDLTGDESLSQRPMARITKPLESMGAEINLSSKGTLPAYIKRATPKQSAFTYDMPIASGQVKSALLLMAAQNGVEMTLTGQLHGRDHTEKLIPYFGGQIDVSQSHIYLPKQNDWHAIEWTVPADLSAASFWIAKTLLESNSKLVLKNVGLNPTRMGFIKALKTMGADIEWRVEQSQPEVVGSIIVRSSVLRAIEINEVTDFIDEVPLLVLLASQAKGISRITGAHELRYKESDRIRSTQSALGSLRIRVEALEDGFVVEGNQAICAGTVDPQGDHRIAMLGLVAKSSRNKNIEVLNPESANVSDPHFVEQVLGSDL